MRVIAKKMGFYGGSRIREGQEFDVPEGAKGKWFAPVGKEPVAEPEPEKPATSKKAKANGPATFSELAKQDSAAQVPKGTADSLV